MLFVSERNGKNLISLQMTGVTAKLDNIESNIQLLRCKTENVEYSQFAEKKGTIISHFRIEEKAGSIRLFWMDKNKENAENDS